MLQNSFLGVIQLGLIQIEEHIGSSSCILPECPVVQNSEVNR